MQLDIQPEDVKTLRDALQHISHPQTVQVSIPTRPGAILDATQQVLIEALHTDAVQHSSIKSISHAQTSCRSYLDCVLGEALSSELDMSSTDTSIGGDMPRATTINIASSSDSL